MDNRPIGVFDSGYGGISVLAAAVCLLPGERFIYLGDNLHAPYGALPETEIMIRTWESVQALITSGCKAIVIACNTATSVAAATLRKVINLPIIAMEPALKPASMVAGEGRVLVMATEVTLKLHKFHSLMESYDQTAVPIPTPRLVTAVEAGLTDGPEVRALLERYLTPYLVEPVKAVVLGCTHFVFLKQALQAYLPANIQLIDGNEGTARQLKKRLAQEKLAGAADEADVWKRVEFRSTKTDAETLARMRTLFQIALDQTCEQ